MTDMGHILSRDPTKEHPSQYSAAVLEAMTPCLRQLQLPVHDPFAGTGVRLGALCDRLKLRFTGTEKVGPFIVDSRVAMGDSTLGDTYPAQPYAIVTSPVYPNGMADHFKASEPEGRHTYRQARHRLTGEDQPLDERNMGRYSVRGGTKAFAAYSVLAEYAAEWWWPSVVIINVSDFYVGDDVFPLVHYWRELLRMRGYKFAADVEVATPRQRRGANGEKRVAHEVVMFAFPKEGRHPRQPATTTETYRRLGGKG